MSDGHRVLLLLPFSPEAGVGNATTARRLKAGLERFGHRCTAMGVPQDLRPDAEGHWVLPEDLLAAASETDVVIALHAVRSGSAAAALKKSHRLPYLVMFTGTDLNGKPPTWAIEATRQADACIALAPSAKKRAAEVYGLEQIDIILQAAAPLPEPRGGARMPDRLPKLDAGDFLIFLPSGVRPVKDPRRGVQALRKAANRHPQLKLWIAGESLDEKETEALNGDVAKYPWAEYVGPLTPAEMAPVMRRANLVLSTSRSEGGPPNALLEAALFARPIAASNIAIHRFFPGSNCIFRENSDLVRMVGELIDEPQRAALQARQLSEETRTRFDRTKEAVAWDRLVRKAMNNPWKSK
jgi:L-malate glycosyltransferase